MDPLPGKQPVLVVGTIPGDVIEHRMVYGLLQVHQMGDAVTVWHPDVAALTFHIVAIIAWHHWDRATRAYCRKKYLVKNFLNRGYTRR